MIGTYVESEYEIEPDSDGAESMMPLILTAGGIALLILLLFSLIFIRRASLEDDLTKWDSSLIPDTTDSRSSPDGIEVEVREDQIRSCGEVPPEGWDQKQWNASREEHPLQEK